MLLLSILSMGFSTFGHFYFSTFGACLGKKICSELFSYSKYAFSFVSNEFENVD